MIIQDGGKVMTKKNFGMFKLIVAIFPKGKVKTILPVIKEAGIFGATVLSGKGLCAKEGARVLGLRIGPLREILLLVTLEANRKKLVKLLEEHGRLKEPGKGIIFVMDICEVIG
ncbi:MAG TPA: P-II family nitrogen regulator [Candidatus Omnitrophota bacterium]|nr:P-II family nitrogen regulator [Candidatus Omnitrophota bacterium]